MPPTCGSPKPTIGREKRIKDLPHHLRRHCLELSLIQTLTYVPGAGGPESAVPTTHRFLLIQISRPYGIALVRAACFSISSAASAASSPRPQSKRPPRQAPARGLVQQTARLAAAPAGLDRSGYTRGTVKEGLSGRPVAASPDNRSQLDHEASNRVCRQAGRRARKACLKSAPLQPAQGLDLGDGGGSVPSVQIEQIGTAEIA